MSDNITSDLKLYIREQVDKVRNQAIVVISLITTLIATICTVFIFIRADKTEEDLLSKTNLKTIEEKAESKFNEIKKIADKTQAVANEIQDLRDGKDGAGTMSLLYGDLKQKLTNSN